MFLGGEEQPSLNPKVKRKDFDEFSEDFSGFSISVPARKIRRLNVNWPLKTDEVLPATATPTTANDLELSSPQFINTERAIVLFNSDHLPHSPTDQSFSVSLNQDILAGLKNKSKHDLREEGEGSRSSMEASAQCFAIVPWAPSRIPCAADFAGEKGEGAPMDEEMVEDAMELEGEGNGQMQGVEINGGTLPTWLHQQCWMPQPPQNVPTTPVTWFR